MTPFLEAISKLKNPEQLATLKLLHHMDSRGFVNLTWEQAFALFGSQNKARIRTMLAHMKRTGLLTANTNSFVNIHFTSAHILREYAHILREYAHNDDLADEPSAHNKREYAHNKREYAHNKREYAHDGGTIGGNKIHTYIDPVLKDFSLKENNLSIYVSTDESRSIIEMLTDEIIAMPQVAAEVAAATTKPERVLSIVSAYLAEVENGNARHNAMGLFKRLTWREDGRYRFPAKTVPDSFWRSDYAARHGLEPPRSPESSGYELPPEFADIVIG